MTSAHTCLPAGFSFKCYEPLDPNIPSTAAVATSNTTTDDTSSSAAFVSNIEIVQEALDFFPSFAKESCVSEEEKQPVGSVAEAARVLAEGRALRRHVADLERTIEDQLQSEEAKTEAAIKVLRDKAV